MSLYILISIQSCTYPSILTKEWWRKYNPLTVGHVHHLSEGKTALQLCLRLALCFRVCSFLFNVALGGWKTFTSGKGGAYAEQKVFSILLHNFSERRSSVVYDLLKKMLTVVCYILDFLIYIFIIFIFLQNRASFLHHSALPFKSLARLLE